MYSFLPYTRLDGFTFKNTVTFRVTRYVTSSKLPSMPSLLVSVLSLFRVVCHIALFCWQDCLTSGRCLQFLQWPVSSWWSNAQWPDILSTPSSGTKASHGVTTALLCKSTKQRVQHLGIQYVNETFL